MVKLQYSYSLKCLRVLADTQVSLYISSIPQPNFSCICLKNNLKKQQGKKKREKRQKKNKNEKKLHVLSGFHTHTHTHTYIYIHINKRISLFIQIDYKINDRCSRDIFR